MMIVYTGLHLENKITIETMQFSHCAIVSVVIDWLNCCNVDNYLILLDGVPYQWRVNYV